MKHVSTAVGCLAALTLIAVSAAMNYRFGTTIGRTDFDAQVYGAASVAADLLKALVPFFVFAALAQRQWMRAIAASIVGIVFTAYSLTSAIGHTALNRLDVAGVRQVAANSYLDSRLMLSRLQDQRGWIPAHRPAETVAADLNLIKADKLFAATEQCVKILGPTTQGYCARFRSLEAEYANAVAAERLDARIEAINKDLGTTHASSLVTADPQAEVLAQLSGVDTSSIQTAMALFVAILIELGSTLGLYVALNHTPAKSATKLERPHGDNFELEPDEDDTINANDNAHVGDVGEPEQQGVATENVIPFGSVLAELVENDTALKFVAHVTENEPGEYEMNDLYDRYQKWCAHRQASPLTIMKLQMRLKEMGVSTRYHRPREKNGRKLHQCFYYIGVPAVEKVPRAA